MDDETKAQLQALVAEYRSKKDDLWREYGEADGFIVGGKPWYETYGSRAQELIAKAANGALTMGDFLAFYRGFGFGPKLYPESIRESGIERVRAALNYLADPEVSASEKYEALCLDAESPHYIKGIGPSFVTLFLTSLFPTRFGQFNQPIKGGLEQLGLLPPKAWGQSKGAYYERVNAVLLDVMEATGLPSLPEVDNLLYCFYRGYIGGEGPTTTTTPAPPEVEEEQLEEEPVTEVAGLSHADVQYYLIQIGRWEGYDVWVARNDRSRVVDGESFQDLTLEELPIFASRDVLEVASYVDVIWFRRAERRPVRFFEIEATTSIYSGLLRLNDISCDYPIPLATIVLPADRMPKFEREIGRRTFALSELSDKCEARTFEQVKARYDALRQTRGF